MSDRMTAERKAEIKNILETDYELGTIVAFELLAELEAVEAELKDVRLHWEDDIRCVNKALDERDSLRKALSEARQERENVVTTLIGATKIIRKLVGVLKFYIEGWPYHKEDPTDSKETV